MAVKKPSTRKEDSGRKTVRDEPPLGSMRGKVLLKVLQLRSEAYGYKVLEGLMEDARDSKAWIDPAQVYTSLKKLLDVNYIEKADSSRVEKRGPPAKVYRVTREGLAALQATSDYHQMYADKFNVQKLKRSRT